MTVTVNSFMQSVGKSFSDSFGDIVFGMEDGTVSIFGLVFGVAASSNSSSAVLLAGATGAIAAAVSMMAGTYLDVTTTRDQTQAQIALLPIASARIISVIVTAILLILLGIGRGIIGKRNVLITIVETVGIATIAALAGFLIGKLVAG